MVNLKSLPFADILIRHINFANTTPDELKQLSQASEGFDETEYNLGKLGTECFALTLDPFRTGLAKIISGYLLEGQESTKEIKFELYGGKLNIYSRHLFIIQSPPTLYYITVQARAHFSSLTSTHSSE